MIGEGGKVRNSGYCKIFDITDAGTLQAAPNLGVATVKCCLCLPGLELGMMQTVLLYVDETVA